MDNKHIGLDVLKAVGGKENVICLTHCMTRLRFNLKDDKIPKDEEVKNISGVMGVVRSGGQYQIVIGQNVPKVYAEICKVGNFAEEKAIEENLDSIKNKFTIKGIFSYILNYMAGSLTPLIPLLMVAGLFKMIPAVIGPDMLKLVTAESDIYILFDFAYQAGFYFLPILLGYNAAKKLGATPILGAYMGCILITPSFLALVDAGSKFTVFGIPSTLNDYSQSVLPIILSVWVLNCLEKFFKKILPDMLTTIFTPFLTMFLMLPISLCLLAPLGSILGNYVGKALIGFGDVGGFVAVALVAALWELLVMSGMHLIIIIMLITNYMETGTMVGIGISPIYATIAVFGVALGGALRLKNKEDRSLAISSFMAGFLGGVTEPTLYGLCMKFKRCFLTMMIGAALGGIYGGIFNNISYVMGSSNFMIPLSFVGGSTINTVNGFIGCGIAFVASTVLTFLFGFSKAELEARK